MNNLYHLLIQSLIQKNKFYARILVCVIYARRSFIFRALKNVVTVNSKETYINYEQCEQNKSFLTSNAFYNVFDTLLNVAKNKVYCIHQFVKNYLKRCNFIKNFVDFDSRIFLTHVSMAYLSLKDFEYFWQNRNMFRRNFSFLNYVATYWYSHIETITDFRCHFAFQNFLKKIISFLNFKAQFWMSEHYWSRYISRSFRISEIAIYFDIEWLAKLLLNKKSCDIVDDFEKNCLSQAVKIKKIVLKVLLKHEKSIKFTITDVIVQHITTRHRCVIIILFFDRRNDDVHITAEVKQATAKNFENDKKIIILFFDRRDDDVYIITKVI